MFDKILSGKNLPEHDFDHFQIEQRNAEVIAVSFCWQFFFTFWLTTLIWNFKWNNLPQEGKYFIFKLTILEKEDT